jgi:hypothetical protein
MLLKWIALYLDPNPTSAETLMKAMKPLLLASLAAVAVGGYAGLARAGAPDVKTMTVQLPGGGIEEIEYTGDVAPQVSLLPATPAAMADPFAALAQISAEMDQQAAAMMNAMDAMAAGGMGPPGALVPAAFGQMPLNGACVQSLQITSLGNGQAPQVVSRTSGDCGGSQPRLDAPALPAALPAAPMPSASQPQLIRVRYILPQAPSHPSNS